MTNEAIQQTDHRRFLSSLASSLASFAALVAILAALSALAGCAESERGDAPDALTPTPETGSTDALEPTPELGGESKCHTRPPVCPDRGPVSQCGACLQVHLEASMQDRSPHYDDARECLCRPLSFVVPQTLPVTSGDAGSGTAKLLFHDTAKDRQVTCEYRGNGTGCSKGKKGTVGDRYTFVRCDDNSRAGDTRKSDWFALQVRGKGKHARRTTVLTSFAESCGCKPTTCAAAHAECGSIPDGCGGTLSCGICTSPETCGGGGVANQCGCKPATCSDLGVTCGVVPDGCGGTLDCGVCCKAIDECHLAGVRDPVTGVCSNPPAPNGTSCNDHNSCTSNDVCTQGQCAGTPYTCDDGLGCTTDSCNGDGSCTFAINPGYCVADGACHVGGTGPSDPPPNPPTSNEPVPMTLTSERLDVDIDWNGRFALGAVSPDSEPWNLLYGWPNEPWSTSTTIRYDDHDAHFGDFGSDNQFLQYPYDAGSRTSVAKWRMGPIVITQTLRIVANTTTGNPDVLKIEYDVANTDSESHDVGVRMLMDTNIDNNDGAPFRIPGRSDPITTETELLGAEIPQYYQAFYGLDDPAHVVQGTLSGADATRPDRLAMVYWFAASTTDWDYQIIPGAPFGNPTYPDSAVLLYWNPQSLAAGASRRYVTYYGLGSLSGSPTLGLSGPTRLGLTNNAWSPNPFTVIAYLKNNDLASKTGESLTLSFGETGGLALAPGESATHALPEILPDETIQTAWQVVPIATGTWTYGVSAASSPTLSAQRSVTVPQPWVCVP